MSPSAYVLADQAIETVAQRKFPDHANYNWRTAVPTGQPPTGLGYADAAQWLPEATLIVAELNDLLANAGRPPISPSMTVMKNSAKKTLGDFSLCLGALAARETARPIIRAF